MVVDEGDTLWDLAEEHLGEPTRWPELYDANKPAVGAWSDSGEWPWPQAQSEAFLTIAMQRLAEAGRPKRRTLPLLT